MKVIEVAGIPFSEEMLDLLKWWLVPTALDGTQVQADIDTLNSVQSFLLRHWDNLQNVDKEIKDILTCVDILKQRLLQLNAIKVERNEHA